MSSQQTIIVDDTSSSLVYTGSWSSITNPGAHGNSLHQTTTTGSSNSLTYVGDPTVTIFGSIQPCDAKFVAPAYQIIMDGVPGDPMTVVCNGQFQNGISVSAQGNGPSGVNARHVVTVTNLGGSQNLPLLFDYLQYVSYIGESSSSAVQVGPTSTGAASHTSASSTPAGFSSSTTSAPSGSKTGPSQSASTGLQTLSASTVMQLTTIDGVATSVTVVIAPTTIGGSNSNSVTGGVGRNSSHSTGPIVGGIIGAVLVTLFLVWLYGRWRRTPRSRSSKSVFPFNLAPNPSPEQAGSSASRRSTSHAYQLPPIAQPSSWSTQSEQSKEDSAILSDEKRASGPPGPFQSWNVPSSQTTEPGASSSSSPPSTGPHGPSSSISLSYASVPAYARNQNLSRAHYLSGVSAFSNSDVPPSYDSVRNAESVPPVPPLDPQYSLQETV